MECRRMNSEKLITNVRRIYDGCTNLMMREKLRQLKNQNNALGICSKDILDCVLPDDCSDKALLEYPGFDVVWAKHCKDPGWYPVFK